MEDIHSIFIRFSLYLDLMILFGLPMFGIYAVRGAEMSPGTLGRLRRAYVAGACLGLLLSGLGIAQLTASMSGVPLGQIDWTSASTVIFETTMGTAWQARIAALAVFLGLAATTDVRRPGWAGPLTLSGGLALASLAWGGHGAMSEGSVGVFHLASDIVHLLAAGIWLAALVGFTILLFRRRRDMTPEHVGLSHRALARFGAVGTAVVSLLVVTGLVNSWLLIGIEGVRSLPTSLYGQLLVAKLLLFIGMLGLAALNRYRMTPALADAIASGDIDSAVTSLRTTLLIETASAVLIMGLVAWLGTLAPPLAGL